jgi:hypothetical protein
VPSFFVFFWLKTLYKALLTAGNAGEGFSLVPETGLRRNSGWWIGVK